MITNIRIRNFKVLEDAELKLGAEPATVLIGPNNCGKSSVLHALAMWRFGASQWIAKHSSREKMGAVSIPLSHFVASPTSPAECLWHKQELSVCQPGQPKQKVQIQIDVSGEAGGAPWNIGVEFRRSDRNAVRCSPMSASILPKVPAADIARQWKAALPEVVYAPPMSEVLWREDKLTPGSIVSRLGEGRTEGVLRNILYHALHPEGAFMATPEQAQQRWSEILEYVQRKFLVRLHKPTMDTRGGVRMGYNENERDYHLSSAGRGFQQTLLMLALLHMRPGGLFLLDEPDAHLEGVRQRDNFSMYSEIAGKNDSQLIIASHSAVVMNQAVKQVGPEGLVGMVDGKAMQLNADTVKPFRKLLDSIGWEKVMRAKAAGHVVFLEGRTDIEFLAAFAEKLFGVRAAEKIRLANAELVGNVAAKARELFYALRSGVPELRGFALFDRDALSQARQGDEDEERPSPLTEECWRRREIENYIPLPDALYRLAESEDAALRQKESEDSESLALSLAPAMEKTNAEFMREAAGDIIPRLALRDRNDPYWRDQKMSDAVVRIMERFSELRGGAGAWSKWKCHTLVQYMEPDEIPDEVREKILAVLAVIDPDFDPEEFPPAAQN